MSTKSPIRCVDCEFFIIPINYTPSLDYLDNCTQIKIKLWALESWHCERYQPNTSLEHLMKKVLKNDNIKNKM